ncbi:MAG: hypothetical protein IJJ26_02825 [Victivallales bacterium]|nr:hypothetical protein [Victivallales bacterium]
MKNVTSFLFVLAAVVLFGSSNVQALTFNPFKRVARVQNNTLIIAGNIIASRLLADLAQYHSKQPILLISPESDGNARIYYAPARSRATESNQDSFMDLVNFINPKRIVVLGGNDYVDTKFVDMARAKYPVIILDSNNWSQNAQSLGELLDIRGLDSQYNEYKANIDAVYNQKDAK